MTKKIAELPGTLAFAECCQRVLAVNSKRRPGGMMDYAAAYAHAGLSMTDRKMIAFQASYILQNLAHWRGEEARMVKAQLNEFAKYQGEEDVG